MFRKEGIIPLPGDRVEFSVIREDEKTGFIESIQPRKTQLIRPAVANIDQLAIIIAAKAPEPDFLLLDKLLVTAAVKGIDPLICINKIDLDADEIYKEVVNSYEKTGYPVVAMSSKSGMGIEDFKEKLRGRVTVLAGQSGVGKSTILNNIAGSWVMKTGDISQKIERGKHTTRHAELFELNFGGYVVDTPGFSSFELSGIAFDKLDSCYREFEEYKTKCRFVGCSHLTEPQCGVKDALSKGEIDFGRYERYAQLYNILKEIDSNKYRKK